VIRWAGTALLQRDLQSPNFAVHLLVILLPVRAFHFDIRITLPAHLIQLNFTLLETCLRLLSFRVALLQ